ncbi:hypothetical protein B6U84_01560 [Candidatus Bathyarchaeota archaeon ex4484_40]|nr:MAG: hypothetical protein B6U84_01560 [Candidatus Bathyarchaeota archaeon ex4484_40]
MAEREDAPQKNNARGKIKDKVRGLREAISFVYLEKVYTKTAITHDDSGEIQDVEVEWTLWRGHIDWRDLGLLVYDEDGVVSERNLEYALKVVEDEVVARLENELPRKILKSLLASFGVARLNELRESGKLVTPVPRLRDPSFLREINWRELVEDVVNYRRAVEYEPLVTVRKATLLRGIKQAINPHTIIVLPASTGKTEGYRVFAVIEDRASRKSLIGYATTDGPRPGSLHQCDLPFALDQIEETDAYELLKYLVGLMESDRARVDLAGFQFDVTSKSTIIILANPIGSSASRSFTLLLHHLCRNPTIGRRFGIILYDQDRAGYKVPRIKTRERDLAEELKDAVELFRAVEEYCRPKIKKIVEEAWGWLNQRNEEWVRRALQAISRLQTDSSTEKLYEFLANFIRYGNAHTRGGALYAAIVDNLDKIALEEIENFENLKPIAEDYLHRLLEINYDSVVKIAEAFEEFREMDVLTVFDTLPSYMQEIVLALNWYRHELKRRGVDCEVPTRIPLRKLPYQPRTRGYFSEVLRDAKRSNPLKYNERLRRYFGFELRESPESDLEAVILSPEPVEALEPLERSESVQAVEEVENFEKFENFRIGQREKGDEESYINLSQGKPLSENDSKILKNLKILKTDEYKSFGGNLPSRDGIEDLENEVELTQDDNAEFVCDVCRARPAKTTLMMFGYPVRFCGSEECRRDLDLAVELVKAIDRRVRGIESLARELGVSLERVGRVISAFSWIFSREGIRVRLLDSSILEVVKDA